MQKKYKTKFPVARIKKIMQMDEDVGKVAQATPVLISKALEMFMQSLLDESLAQAQHAHSRRILPGHMKAAITIHPKFDFLRDLVKNVEDAPVAAASADSAAGIGEIDNAAGEEGKRGPGRRRRKPVDSDD